MKEVVTTAPSCGIQSDYMVQTTTRTISLVQVSSDGSYLLPIENRTDFIEQMKVWFGDIRVVDRTIATRTYRF